MATYSGVWAKHAQLSAGVVDTVTLDADYSRVEVVNRNGAAEIYFTVSVDGANPTVGGDNTHVLVAAINGMTVNANAATGNPTTVRLISSGTPTYTVRGA